MVVVGGWYLEYRVSSGPFLRFSMRFELLSEMFDHSVCETRDPSLTIKLKNFISSKNIFNFISDSQHLCPSLPLCIMNGATRLGH